MFIIVLTGLLFIAESQLGRISASTLPADWEELVPIDVRNAMLANHTGSGLDFSKSPYPHLKETKNESINLWTNGIVPFIYSDWWERHAWGNSSKYKEGKALLKLAMDDISQKTCIKFVERKNQTDYLEFLPWLTSYPFYHYIYPGRKEFKGRISQDIRLDDDDQISFGRIQWKLLIALGILEEHRRFDRDDYVIINWDNVEITEYEYLDDKEHLTKFKRDTTFGLPYDYDSVTHAGSMYGAKDRAMRTVVPINPPSANIGQRKGMSELDIIRLRRAYNCSEFATEIPKRTILSAPSQHVANTSATAVLIREDDKLHPSRNDLTDAIMTWPDGKVPYLLPGYLTDDQKQMITLAMDDIQRTPGVCLKFVPQTNETDYLYISSDFGCDSVVGRTGGVQLVHLADYCLKNLGDVQQVLLLALGFIRQHQVYNRDKYITINWDNIYEADWKYFMKYSSNVTAAMGKNVYGDSYDYDGQSVTHGMYTDFAKNASLPTIIPRNLYRISGKLGRRSRLSQKDQDKLRHSRYACPYVVPKLTESSGQVSNTHQSNFAPNFLVSSFMTIISLAFIMVNAIQLTF